MDYTIKAEARKAKRGATAIAPAVAVYLTVALIASAILTASARHVPYYDIDLAITRRLQSYQVPWFDRLMGLVCALGYPIQANILGIVAIGMLYAIGLRWEAVTALFSAITSSLTALGLVLYVNRPRPSENLVRVSNHLPTTSFPSGHTLIFTAVVGFLGYLAFHSPLPKLMRLPLIGVLGAIVLLMGPARIYSGEHWASDVTAGYLIGSTWLALTIKFYQWGKPRYFNTFKRK